MLFTLLHYDKAHTLSKKCIFFQIASHIAHYLVGAMQLLNSKLNPKKSNDTMMTVFGTEIN